MKEQAPTVTGAARGYVLVKTPKLEVWNILVSDMYPGAPLMLEREPDNAADPNAVLIKTHDERELAYIDRNSAAVLAKWMDSGWIYYANVLAPPVFATRDSRVYVIRNSLTIKCVPIKKIGFSQKVGVQIFEDA